MRFPFLLASYGIIVPYFFYQAVHLLMEGNLLFAFLSVLGIIAATQLYRLTLTPQQSRLAAKMASVDDVQAVGPLAEMTSWPDDRIKSMALAALTRLLPRMKASDTQLLSPSQRAQLYHMLKLENAGRHSEYLVALLSALEQVGDTEALSYVRNLAASTWHTLRERRVVEAANACLPFLEGCAQQNRQSQTLLRAISETVPNEHLVRPAGWGNETDHELLVRVAAPVERT